MSNSSPTSLTSRFALGAWFLMLPLSTSARADFSFVHITDTHVTETDKPGSNAAKNAEMYREISALAPQPKFVFNTGDVVEIGTPQEYEFHQKSLQNLTLPLYEAPGNHDVRWNPLGKEGFERGVKGPLYRSWDVENVHFVSLDSTVLLQHWGHFDQKMLDWLRDDLQKVGTERPIVIGFHHWIGRDAVKVDNENELLQITAPYNVKLWLQGHGHSDIQWSINGAPAIMAKGLYQGSYSLIEVNENRLRVLRRTLENPTPTKEVLSIPLARTPAPLWNATARLGGEKLKIEAARGDLPLDARLSFRIGDGKYAPLEARGASWSGEAPAPAMAGEHRVEVRAVLPDGRAYTRFAALSTRPAGAPAPLWVTPVGGAVQSKLVTRDGALYVSTMGGDLVCLDARTGFARWKFATGGSIFSTPLVENGAVYFGSADHNVYALDARTGRLKWKTKTGGAVFGGAALSRGVICIASVDTHIYGLNAQSGQVMWKAKGENMFQSQAATDGERFFVGGWDNFFRALDVATGREIWKQKFGRAFYFSPAIGSPTTGAGRVYVSSNDGVLHAMEAASGKVVWEVPGPALGYSGPLLRGGQIFNASLTPTGLVFAFDAQSGQKGWETPTGSEIYDSSCAWGQSSQGGAVYVGSVNGVFSALRGGDGTLLWQYQLAPGHLLASPATDSERVYIASQNGLVVALPLG
ncbi:MAG: PQQ-binding-like beta-propeller repeat protein [Armatimonadetes bacterium]|nr:PQQ-binding-like beta-propeller repeat protein [Armatimonadota bacterium]